MSSADQAGLPPTRPEGHVITNTRGSSLVGCAGVTLLGGLLIFGVAISSRSWLAILGVIIAVAGVVALSRGLSETRTWEDLDLIVPGWPLALGSNRPVHLVRYAKRPISDRQLTVSGELICREKVTYQQGTDTEVDKHTAFRLPISVVGNIRSGVFTADLPLHIPVDSGGPTMRKNHNEILWQLELDLKELSPVMRRLTFELDVLPALDPSFGSPGVQDAPRSEL